MEGNNWRHIPAIVSHSGQIHGEYKRLAREHIRHKSICFEGQAKKSKVRSALKWWLKCISMIITETASRNVAFEANRISQRIIERQDEFIFSYI